MFINVDFPAPFNPKIANNDFLGIFKFILFNAIISCLVFLDTKTLFKFLISTAKVIFFSF